MRNRILAGGAAAVISPGVASCSQAEDPVTEPTGAEETGGADITEVVPAAESTGFGAPESVEEGPEGASPVTYEGGRYIVHLAETGAQPLVGMIGETWVSEGGFDAPVGLPTAAEMPNGDGPGWTQEFTRGTIA